MILNIPLQPPLKPSSWGDTVIDADKEKSPCAGRNNYMNKFIGSEDCLYLNIFTKNLKPAKPYAVMVYIHGGGYNSGACSLYAYSPDFILMSDIVLVTFNFRFGPLGFLSLKNKSLNVPGNAGLKDQQFAMKFVKDNIRHFGGDPNNITLFGHSTGGTCVSLHGTVESSRGLFHKAIVMSGSAVAKDGLVYDENWALRLANKLGFDGESEHELLSFLEQVDVLTMAEAQYKLIENNDVQFGKLAFGPCIEPYESDSSFMLRPPIDLIRTAWSNDIDIMFGGTIDEGFTEKWDFEQNADYEQLIPEDIKRVIDDQKSKDFANRLKHFYITRSPSEFEGYQKVNSILISIAILCTNKVLVKRRPIPLDRYAAFDSRKTKIWEERTHIFIQIFS